MKKRACSIIALFAACAAPVFAATSATLVGNGKPVSAIVLAAKPTRSAQVAAAELREHIRLMSGAVLPVLAESDALPAGVLPVYVGESGPTRAMGLVSARFAPQESLRRVSERSVVLIGCDDADPGPVSYEKNGAWQGFDARRPFHRLGTLYAVYDLLESLGVRWYMPTDLGTVVPRRATVALPAGERRARPWTLYRLPSKTGWQALEELPEKNKPHKAIPERDAVLYTLRSRIGGEPYGVNHSVPDYSARFGAAHPEWFVGGKPGPNKQLRYDHPGVVEQVAKDAVQFFSRTFAERRFGTTDTAAARVSGGEYFAAMPLDNRDYGETTNPPLQPRRAGPNFGNGTASNYIWSFVNNVAGKIAGAFPDQYVTCCAYAGMFEPPDFALSPNVAVTVCMADGWDGYGMKTLEAWRKRVSRVYTWEYYIDSLERFPRIQPRAIARYLGRLREMGIDGMFIEMPSLPGLQNRNPGLYHVNAYVTFRLLREPGGDIESILKEYSSLFYGPAARPMEKFWTVLEEALADPAYAKAGGSAFTKDWTVRASDARMALLDSMLGQAEKLAGSDPYRARVALVRGSVYGFLEANRASYRRIAESGVPSIAVKKSAETPVIDGRLDDAVWRTAAGTAAFVTLYSKPLDTATTARVARDDKNLYVAFECAEPRMSEIRLDQRSSMPGICTDDSVEVVLDVGRRFKDYVHVMMNADGLLWYRWPGRYAQVDLPDLGIRGAAWKGPDRWTAEFVIPLARLDAPPIKAGDEWGINFYRNRWPTMKWDDPRRWQAWSPLFADTYHVVDRFGLLVF